MQKKIILSSTSVINFVRGGLERFGESEDFDAGSE